MKLEYYLLLIVLIPFVATLFLGTQYLLQKFWKELTIINYIRFALVFGLLVTIYVIIQMAMSGQHQLVFDLGYWFELEDYHFGVTLVFDQLSAPFVFLVYLLSNVIGRYSANYLIGEMGVYRFFFLLLLFVTSILTVTMAGSIDLLFIGWELVGISSVMLIGFYSKREISVKYSFKAFIAYRIGDVGLLSAAMLIHHVTHSADFGEIFNGHWPIQLLTNTQIYTTGVSLLLILASLGKSSQFPLCGWLPKAMEGPTPSSAIFYGALSIHLGPYLLLRMYPFLDQSPIAKILLASLGLITALYGTFVGRTKADVKTTLAYATMAQVGLIMVEISLGWHEFALLHIGGHACLRTLQFLRSSSLLQDFIQNPLVFSGTSQRTFYLSKIFGKRVQRWLYYTALDGFSWDQMINKFLQLPCLKFLSLLRRLEEYVTHLPDAKKENKP
jgi:NADH-quinone oxidoreductase subunit L